MRIGILTVSDRASSGKYVDETGPAIEQMLASKLANTRSRQIAVVADERPIISRHIADACDQGEFDVVITNGGTGLSPRDVTPEATIDVIERQVPGLAEAMRAAGRQSTALADLSRSVVGQRGNVLVVNLPGSPKGALESLGAIASVLPHAVELLASK